MDNIFLVDPDTRNLISPYETLGKSTPIKPAQPFTISLLSAVVEKDLDGFLRGDNDLMILSKSALGENPLVERIHFYEEEVPRGKVLKNFFAENIFMADDYSGLDKLWLELNVLEIDSDTGERKAAINAFKTLASTGGAIFPAAIPYMFAGTTAVGLIERLVSILEKNTHVIKIPFSFYPGAPRLGRAPFQSGTYVMFANPQNPGNFKLKNDGSISKKENAHEISYAVFDIAPQKSVSSKFVMNQKVATLLTQIRSGNTNTPKNTIEFLTETLTSYSNYKKLDRYLEIKGKTKPSKEENELLAEIGKIAELKPFLPKTG